MKILVTGGAGFIGSNLIRYLLDETDVEIFNVDKLTFPGSLLTIQDFEDSTRYSFAQVDICDASAMLNIVMDFAPDAIVHLAAESHVDRSIDSPSTFIHSNIVIIHFFNSPLTKPTQEYTCIFFSHGSFFLS